MLLTTPTVDLSNDGNLSLRDDGETPQAETMEDDHQTDLIHPDSFFSWIIAKNPVLCYINRLAKQANNEGLSSGTMSSWMLRETLVARHAATGRG